MTMKPTKPMRPTMRANSVAGETPLMILRIEQDGDEEILVEIEDADEFERVVAAWEAQTE